MRNATCVVVAERRASVENRRRDIAVLAVLIALVTALHYLTINQEWAIHDFYRRLYYIPIILGAFKFRLRGGVLIAIIISFLYLPHVLFIWGFEDIGFVNQLLEITMFLFIGSIAGYLVEQLYRNNILLSEQLERITEIEILNENILNSMSYPLIALDNNNDIKIVNNAANKVYSDLKLNSNFMDYKNEVFKVIHDPLKSVITGEINHFDEIVRVSEERTHIVSHIKMYPLKNNDNEIKGTVVVIEDITEIYQLEEEIRRADKLSAIGVMASGVAHEIRNPLGIVKTIAQTIKSTSGLSEMDLEGLDIITAEVDRANGVIKEILDFSKIEKGELDQSNLLELVKDVIKITHKFAENNLVMIETDIDEDINCMMDISKMKQVFMNLIMNAVDAMPSGGKVKILGKKQGVKYVISVSDNGSGIPQEKLESIFNPFYTTKDTGTGLGLSITHKIIKDHNGSIKVNSTVGKGTEFVIKLPNDGEAKHEI